MPGPAQWGDEERGVARCRPAPDAHLLSSCPSASHLLSTCPSPPQRTCSPKLMLMDSWVESISTTLPGTVMIGCRKAGRASGHGEQGQGGAAGTAVACGKRRGRRRSAGLPCAGPATSHTVSCEAVKHAAARAARMPPTPPRLHPTPPSPSWLAGRAPWTIQPPSPAPPAPGTILISQSPALHCAALQPAPASHPPHHRRRRVPKHRHLI